MINVGNLEILQIVDSVSRERGIPKADLLEALEQAYQVAGKKKYGSEHEIKAQINSNTGEINLYRALKIVEKVNDILTEISLDDALDKDPNAVIDGEILEKLPPIEMGRVVAQTAKQVIIQKVGEAERARQFEDYKDRKGDVINGTVKRIEFGNIIVDIGRAEGLLQRNHQIRGEIFKVGDRIKAYVLDVRKELKGAQIFLSRTVNEFLCKLLEIEVPEIYDNIIEIKAVARDPGAKAKIAVFAPDASIDPVGACVGIKGSRIRAITNELSGEKIDVILWNKNLAQFIINAITPAQISKIVFDEEKNRVEAVVAEDQFSLAIGKRGQNVRLASKITGWNIDILTEDQESKKRTEEFTNNTELFKSVLDVEELIAQLLSSEGYNSIYQIAATESSTLANIEGFTLELAEEIKARASAWVEQQNSKLIEQLEQLGVEQELLDLLPLQPEYILKLAEYGVKTIEDLAEMSFSEFREIVPNEEIASETIDELIKIAKENSNE